LVNAGPDQRYVSNQHLSSFRGIAGFIGDEPGIHFCCSLKGRMDSRFRPQKARAARE
jgi:hypothetical protein